VLKKKTVEELKVLFEKYKIPEGFQTQLLPASNSSKSIAGKFPKGKGKGKKKIIFCFDLE